MLRNHSIEIMGQSMCGGHRHEVPNIIDMSIFEKSKIFCGPKENSPYFKRKIRRAERKAANAKLLYQRYLEKKNQELTNNFMCKSRIRSNSN